MPPAPALLKALLSAAGPSGFEDEPARIWREAASSFAEVTFDTLGSSFARVRAGEGAPTVAVVGHIDEIGVTITNIADNGLLSFATIGGISPEMLLGQHVRLMTQAGLIVGAVGRKPIAPEKFRDRPRIELGDLHIDIGAKDREDAERLVRVGDAGVWDGAPEELPNGRLLSRALDNRLGSYVALEAARRVAESGDARVDLVAVAAVQEEIGLFGARTVAYNLDPAVAITIDVTPTTDTGGDPNRAGRVEFGMGAMIGRAPVLNRHVGDLLAKAADDEGIGYGFEVYTHSTSTDADEIHIARAGVPTGLISVPTRYLHSPCEMCDLADLEAVVQLVVAFVRRLSPDESFLR